MAKKHGKETNDAEKWRDGDIADLGFRIEKWEMTIEFSFTTGY